METNPNNKPETYLGQVFQSPFFSVVIGIMFLALLYTGSLLLFADWSEYDDPFGSRRNAIGVFVTTVVVLGFAFLVPLFSREYVSARRTHIEPKTFPETPEFVIGDPVNASVGPKNNRAMMSGTVTRVYPENGNLKYTVRSIDDVNREEEVFAYQVYKRNVQG